MVIAFINSETFASCSHLIHLGYCLYLGLRGLVLTLAAALLIESLQAVFDLLWKMVIERGLNCLPTFLLAVIFRII